MKRGLLILSILFLLTMPFVFAETEDITKAYTCLDEKVTGKCSSLTIEEKIFSLLALGKCSNEVLADAKDNECWPKSNCDVKTTAQAILALHNSGTNTLKAEKWLLAQNTTPLDIDWYLEIESSEATTCTITYSGSSYSVDIGADKKISSSAGSCLSLSDGNWWLKIDSSCYSKEFAISCDKGFLTTLLYQKSPSSTIYVSEETNSASAGGTTKEKVNSYCFAQGGSCNYEGSLWAALVLDHLEHDAYSYLPYLITSKSENNQYLPDAFLYKITTHTNFRSNLLSFQKSSKWWEESGNKFYDTALALMSLYYETMTEKENAKTWLLEVQADDGCWNSGNIRDTAFVLYSVWPKEIPSNGNNGNAKVDCEDSNNYCLSSMMSCDEAEGEILTNYTCSGVNVCCTKKISNECVADLNGEVCSSDEDCEGGDFVGASDLYSGQRCCVDGTCEESSVSTCESYGGTCRNSCNDSEEENNDQCDSSSDVCCVATSAPTPDKSYWWIWVLLILIVLVLAGIIFRNKLRTFWFRIKSKNFKSSPSKPGFSMPSKTPMNRMMPRRIFPPTQRPMTRTAYPLNKPNPKGELDDVLKKLKDMGK